jgi:LacI family transcriptional regulator, galactose operon repressor
MKFDAQDIGIKPAGDALKQYIISSIKSGELQPGMPLLSTRVLSKKFTISVNTAQRVLKELSEEEYLIRQHGKQTIVADSKEVSEDITVGTLFFGLGVNPFHAVMASAVSNYALKNGIRIVSGSGEYHNPIDETKNFLDKLKDNGIKYCIMTLQSTFRRKEIWDYIEKTGIKVVIMNDFWHNGGPFSSIRTNEEYGCQLMFEHLLDLGHKRILLLDEHSNTPRYYALNAFRQILSEKSVEFTNDMVHYIEGPEGPYIWELSDKLVKNIINNFTAVYCTYDIYALRLMQRLRDAGIKVGKDISVAGFDNITQSENAELTTVAQPINELVKNAFKLLFSKDKEKKCICLSPELIIRNSTGPCL